MGIIQKVAKYYRDPLKENTLLGYGMPLGGEDWKIGPITIPDRSRLGHFICFGSTGTGKTRLIEHLVSEDIMKGRSVVYIDPKGDEEILSKIIQTAFACGREEEIIFISPIYPSLSATIDPLSHYFLPEELAAHITSSIETNQEFFINVAYESTLTIILGLILIQKYKPEKKIRINLGEIAKWIDHASIGKLFQEVSELQVSREDYDSYTTIVDVLQKILASPPEYYGKISTTLRTVMTSMTTGNVGMIIGKAKSNQFVERLERQEKVIMVIQTGSLLTRRTSNYLARMIVSMIQSLVGRFLAAGRKIDSLLSIHMDEFKNTVYPGIEEMFNKVRSAGVMLHAYTQSVSDLETVLGREKAEVILDNCNTKLVMKVNHPQTAEYVASLAGKEQKMDLVLNLGGGMMARSSEDNIIQPSDVLELKNRQFFLFSSAGNFKGRTPDVPNSFLQVQYPHIHASLSDSAFNPAA